MEVQFSNLMIRGIASALPLNTLDLSTLSDLFGELEVKRIISSTGIRKIRSALVGMNCSDLCFAATKRLLRGLDVPANSIDAIVFVSQTPDYIAPPTSVILQNRLGLSHNAVAFDINYGCSGYIYGLYQAALLLSAGGCQRVLVCAGDVITPLLDPLDRQVRLVLADAGSATLVEKGSDNFSVVLKTDGSGFEYLLAAKTFPNSLNKKTTNLLDGYFHMNGGKVMEFALREVPSIIDHLLTMKNWNKNEVGTFALHQANLFMLNYLRKKAQLPMESVPIAVEEIGNTGPASIPVLLSVKGNELYKKNRLEKVLMCGFGVGLSWGAIGVNLSNTSLFSPIEI
jgi:3-oxoacyl-[acyl-carrier-protein] synthase III